MEQPLNAELQAARELVMQYGWNSVVYQVLNPGFQYWFSKQGDAFAGYVRRAGYWVVGGAPVCDKARLPEVVDEFEDAANATGCHVIYFGAGLRLYEGGHRPPVHGVVALGAQPVWNPANWKERVYGHRSLRAQFNRARNKQVHVEEWPAEKAQQHPMLQTCLANWLQRRPMPPMHFLVEPDTLSFLQDRRVFAAEQAGHTVAYLVASPIPVRQGWLIEQIVRHEAAPNGTAELLLDCAIQELDRGGARYVTLGLAPLSSRSSQQLDAQQANAPWLRLMLSWVRDHGRKFYNFDGLDAFKAKFLPDSWEPVFAISSEPTFTPRALYAIAAAFSDRSPVSQVTRAVIKSLRAH